MLEWNDRPSGDSWAATDGLDYLISIYHHGTEIVVTCNDDDGNNVLYEKVPSVRAGKSTAEQHYKARMQA
jgi:hypothetical protein